MPKPTISVIIPVYNEAVFIEEMVQSVLGQEQENFILELLIVDGGSNDGTREKIIALQNAFPFIRLIENKKKITPAAFNCGIKEAKGEYIAILGAHCKYEKNYLEVCLEQLQSNKRFAGCSGKITIARNAASMQSRLIYYLLTSNFGVSSKSYRTAKEGISTQCPYPLFRRAIFDEVGLYNETLIRNQDNDMNYRIRNAGYQLYYTHKVSAHYYPKSTFAGLFNYAIKTGKWNTVSLMLSPRSMELRHLIPFFFTLGLLILSSFSLLTAFFYASFFAATITALLGFLILYFIAAFIQAFIVYKNHRTPDVYFLPFLFFAFHFSYGWGTLIGFFQKNKAGL